MARDVNSSLPKAYVFVLIACVVGFVYVIYPSRILEMGHSHSEDKLLLLLEEQVLEERREAAVEESSKKTDEETLKYILQWSGTSSPFDMMGVGQSAFKKYNCPHSNCFVTDKIDYFPDLTQFDAIAFSGKHIHSRTTLPSNRSQTQKYIFGATESAHNYRICAPVYDGFFNWTWTYRLDSDFRWGYVTVYDLAGNVIGPKADMTWPELDPVNEELKAELRGKKKMAAWFVTDCHTLNKREDVVRSLKHEGLKYGWTVDVYGSCGPFKCPRSQAQRCFNLLRKDYYFYLSFENSFAVDYVTEKLLNALNNNVVPVVYGAADYSRFLPPGSYLDARELGPAKLAEVMDYLSKNHTAYSDFFRWQNHFRYKETTESDICNLCAALNDKDAMRNSSVYKDFRRWWNDKQWDGRDC